MRWRLEATIVPIVSPLISIAVHAYVISYISQVTRSHSSTYSYLCPSTHACVNHSDMNIVPS